MVVTADHLGMPHTAGLALRLPAPVRCPPGPSLPPVWSRAEQLGPFLLRQQDVTVCRNEQGRKISLGEGTCIHAQHPPPLDAQQRSVWHAPRHAQPRPCAATAYLGVT
jgi:hypothetical protein